MRLGIGLGVTVPIIGRGSSGPPTPPVAGPVLWLRGSEVLTSSWPSPTGTGLPSSASGSCTPLANQQNGKSVALFSSSIPNIFTFPSSESFDLVSGFDIFVCGFNSDASQSQSQVFVARNGSISSANLSYAAIIRDPSSGIRSDADLGIELNGSWADRVNGPAQNAVIDVPAIWTFESNTSVASIWKNGLQQATAGISGSMQTTMGSLQIGGYDASFSGGEHLTGGIYEVLVYPILSSSDRKSVQAYLANQYNIPLGQPQISTVDFSGQSGANYFTAGPGKYFTLYGLPANSQFYFWFNTGTETDPGITGTGIEIIINPSTNDLAIASAVQSAASAYSNTWTSQIINGSGNTPTEVKFTGVPIAGSYYPTSIISDTGATGAVFDTIQNGIANS